MVQVILEGPAILRGISVVLVVLEIKVLVSLCGLSRHLIQPSKVWFALDFFQHLMHWFSEYSPDVLRVSCLRLPCKISPRTTVGVSVQLCGLSRHLIQPSKVWFALDFFQHFMHWFSEYSPDVLRVGCLRLPCEISPRMTVGVSVQPEIPPLLRDNLLLSLALHLVFFYSLVLIDPIHQLAHAGGRLVSQGFPQAIFNWEAALESVDGDVVKVAIHFIRAIHFFN